MPPRLYVIADLDFLGGDVERWLALLHTLDAAAAEVPLWIQVRAKSLNAQHLAVAARQARDAIRRAPLLLNGPDDLAGAIGYDGAHWTEQRLTEADDAPPRIPIVSAAVHSESAARRAAKARVHALVCGAVWTPSWKPTPGMGLATLRAIVEATALPVFAVGGITPAHCVECRAAGAHGVAILSGVCGAADPFAAVLEYAKQLGAGTEDTALP